jgi:hypothetical protein
MDNNKEIIEKLKTDLADICFTVKMMDNYLSVKLDDKYQEGLEMITKAIKEGLYQLNNDEFYSMLKELIGSYDLVSTDTYYVALQYIDFKLLRQRKSTLEYFKYLGKLMKTNINKKITMEYPKTLIGVHEDNI